MGNETPRKTMSDHQHRADAESCKVGNIQPETLIKPPISISAPSAGSVPTIQDRGSWAEITFQPDDHPTEPGTLSNHDQHGFTRFSQGPNSQVASMQDLGTIISPRQSTKPTLDWGGAKAQMSTPAQPASDQTQNAMCTKKQSPVLDSDPPSLPSLPQPAVLKVETKLRDFQGNTINRDI